MKLSAQSRTLIEGFLRDHFGNPQLKLPPLRIYCGWGAKSLTGLFRVGAITIGRFVFVSPEFTKRQTTDNYLIVPGWLIVHEAIHVLQYQQAGVLRFGIAYLREYWRALRQLGDEGWDQRVRMAAYLAIDKERAAREAEEAYKDMLIARQKLESGEIEDKPASARR